LYQKLLRRLRGRRTAAALTMTLSLTLLVIIPLALVAYNLADNVASSFDQIRAALDQGELLPPAWVRDIPLVGDQVDNYLRQLVASRERMMELARRMVEPARHALLSGGMMLGAGVAQMSLAAFVSFFFYRDGAALMNVIAAARRRIMGDDTPAVLDIVGQTVRGVM
jgi:predicted PurR-regulated permease PerM